MNHQTNLIKQGYAELLDSYTQDYKLIHPYLQVGEMIRREGWTLHLSVIGSRLVELLTAILPLLISKRIPFKLVKDGNTASQFLHGVMGNGQVGKLVCIYPENEEQALQLARSLCELTAHFTGPAIPEEIYLGGIVYTCYGRYDPELPITRKKKRILPKDSHWPYGEIALPVLPATRKILGGNYIPVTTLASHAKGWVAKGINFKRRLHPSWCVIKQGKKCMCEEEGYDMQDRIWWQHQLHTELAGYLPLPAVYDVFTDGWDDYLVMEYIEGVSLQNWSRDLFKGRYWWQLSSGEQVKLLDVLIKIVVILEQLQASGFIHRDITPDHFILTSKLDCFLIDLELAYNQKTRQPSSPFKQGTLGFMSPQQAAGELPSFADDVYGSGALLLATFTQLSPTQFTPSSTEFPENLYFYTGCQPLVSCVTCSLDKKPEKRPALAVARNMLESYREEIIRAIPGLPSEQMNLIGENVPVEFGRYIPAFLEVICALFILLFLYASTSKWIDIPAFSGDMHNQPFPTWLASGLVWTIPSSEIVISLALMRYKWRLAGLYASLVIMASFTLYTAAILLHFFPRVPCSCGGVIRHLSWGQHLLFNLFFVLLALIGIILRKRFPTNASELRSLAYKDISH